MSALHSTKSLTVTRLPLLENFSGLEQLTMDEGELQFFGNANLRTLEHLESVHALLYFYAEENPKLCGSEIDRFMARVTITRDPELWQNGTNESCR